MTSTQTVSAGLVTTALTFAAWPVVRRCTQMLLDLGRRRDGGEALTLRCRCGLDVRHAFQHFGCLQCGTACCAACVITLESVAYCRLCASALLEATASRPGERFDLY